MKIFIVFMSILVSLLIGCEDNMSSELKIGGSLEKARTPVEEAEILEKFLNVIKSKNTPITIGISENNIEIPLQGLGEKLNADLTVNISFDDGSSFKWKPLDNQNIFLLLRE